MIELPEAISLARQLNEAVIQKTVRCVHPSAKPHKFCWFNGDVAEYENQIKGERILSAEGFGIYVETSFSNGKKLCVNDGVNLRLVASADAPKNYQLMIDFTDDTSLVFTVAMYGGIILHGGDYGNEYYLKSRGYTSPFSSKFEKYYFDTLALCKPNLSAKAWIATEQRFPGIGNGVSQDILFEAGINPKRKLGTLHEAEHERLLSSMVGVLREMCERGGRDTEKDIYGMPGGYRTRMSKNTIETGCPRCGGSITKENYLGGSVYYCAHCQPLIK